MTTPASQAPTAIAMETFRWNDSTRRYDCTRCYKTFGYKHTVERHVSTCQAIKNPNECPKCHQVFSSRQTKSLHLKICTFVPIVPETPIRFSLIQSTEINFLCDHIPEKVMLNKLLDYEWHTSFYEYGKLVFNFKKNRCIRKTDKKSDHCEIHVGNNKWELYSDEHVIPRVISILGMNIDIFCNSDLGKKHIKPGRAQAFEDIVDRKGTIYKKVYRGVRLLILKYSIEDGYCRA